MRLTEQRLYTSGMKREAPSTIAMIYTPFALGFLSIYCMSLYAGDGPPCVYIEWIEAKDWGAGMQSYLQLVKCQVAGQLPRNSFLVIIHFIDLSPVQRTVAREPIVAL